MQQMVAFYHKDINMINIGGTLANLANNFPHKPTTWKKYSSRRKMKTYWNFLKLFLVVYLAFLHEKQLLFEFLFGIQQTFANPMILSMLTNYGPFRCVNWSSLVVRSFWISFQRQGVSNFDKGWLVVRSFCQRTRSNCIIESSCTTSRQKEVDHFSNISFFSHCNTVI